MFTERFGVALLNDDTFALWTMEDVIEFLVSNPGSGIGDGNAEVFLVEKQTC